MTTQKARPTLLTVLCILSFIGIGFSLIGSLNNALRPDNFINKVEQSQALLEDYDETGSFLDSLMKMGEVDSEMVEKIVPLSVSAIILSLLLLFGVIQMWNLKKQGFYIYMGVKVLSFIVPIIIVGHNFNSGLALGFGIFFSLLFIFLYSLNLKAME
jgi:hypothetical protein